MNKKLLNITLRHAYFQNRDELLVKMDLPDESRRLARNYGLLIKFRSHQIQVYSLDGFDKDDIMNSGPLWIYLDFLTEKVTNVTDADMTPDKHTLYFDCTANHLQSDSPVFEFGVSRPA